MEFSFQWPLTCSSYLGHYHDTSSSNDQSLLWVIKSNVPTLKNINWTRLHKQIYRQKEGRTRWLLYIPQTSWPHRALGIIIWTNLNLYFMMMLLLKLQLFWPGSFWVEDFLWSSFFYLFLFQNLSLNCGSTLPPEIIIWTNWSLYYMEVLPKNFQLFGQMVFEKKTNFPYFFIVSLWIKKCSFIFNKFESPPPTRCFVPCFSKISLVILEKKSKR